MMIRALCIAVLGCFVTGVAGCAADTDKDPIWKDLKIGDLAPATTGKNGGRLNTINFRVLVFEIPAEKSGALDAVRAVLYAEPVRFRNLQSFTANSFSVAFGQSRMWARVADLLYKADAQRLQNISLMLSEGEINDVPIAGLAAGQSVFHKTGAGSFEAAGAGPGLLALRVKAEKVSGLRGICNLSAAPVFVSALAGTLARRNLVKGSAEFEFTSAEFRLKMAAGDFFIMAPAKQIDNEAALGSYFFSRPHPGMRRFFIRRSEEAETRRLYFGPVVRFYLFVCISVGG